ncbi:hypothetical protein QC590_10275, partial [Pseudomonas putida]|uniref:hypothetical protein n=1 Tax=Pseudomonas putida TaxID=303 RepID=UPI003350C3D5
AGDGPQGGPQDSSVHNNYQAFMTIPQVLHTPWALCDPCGSWLAGDGPQGGPQDSSVHNNYQAFMTIPQVLHTPGHCAIHV